MAVSIRLSNTRLWLLLGALGATGAHQMACSSTEFRSCNETRTCAPEPEASSGSAGDESAGADDGGGQANAGVAGTDDGEPGGAPEEGGSGGLAGAGVSDGGSDAGDGGSAGNAGAAGGGPVFGECRFFTATGPKVPLATGSAVPPILTNGEIHAGHYRQTKGTYFPSRSESPLDSPSEIQIELSGSTAAIYLGEQTVLIEMADPPTAEPRSLKLSCNEFAPTQVGFLPKDSIRYQADSATIELLILNPNDWSLLEYTLDP